MSYKLVIAEKPSVAQSIAKVIGADKREDGYLVNIPVQFEPAVRSLRATIPETQSHRYCHQKHYSTVLLT